MYHRMSYSPGRALKTLRLEESVVRLAANLASRYNVTVPQLIEALLLDYAEREMQGQASPAPALMQPQPSREDGRVIDFGEARLRRRQRDAARFPEAP